MLIGGGTGGGGGGGGFCTVVAPPLGRELDPLELEDEPPLLYDEPPLLDDELEPELELELELDDPPPPDSALHVSGPTIPSADKPFDRWKLCTADLVSDPNLQSCLTLNPWFPRRLCRRHTLSPLLPDDTVA